MPKEVLDLEKKGVASEDALEICLTGLNGVSREEDAIAAIDGTMGEVALLAAAVEYPINKDLNFAEEAPTQEVAICVVGGVAARDGFDKERIVVYYLDGKVAGGVLYAY